MPRPEYLKAVDDFWTTHGGLFERAADQPGPAEAQQQPSAPELQAKYLERLRLTGNVPDAAPPQSPSFRGLTPEAYGRVHGEMRPASRPQEYLQPAYQGAADGLNQIAVQPVAKAVESGNAFIDEPTAPNFARAGLDTVIAALPGLGPVRAAKAAGAVVAAGAVPPVLQTIAGSEAHAADKKDKYAGVEPLTLPGLSPETQLRAGRLKEQLRREDYASGAERRSIETELNGYLNTSSAFGASQAQADAKAREGREAAETEVNRQASLRKQEADGAKTAKAGQLRDEILRRPNAFAETPIGEYFSAVGAYAPALAGVVGGGIAARGAAANRRALVSEWRQNLDATDRALLPPIDRFANGKIKPWQPDHAAASVRGETAARMKEVYEKLPSHARYLAGPAALGALDGAVTANVPTAYNAFMSPAVNPQREAYQAYARELPGDHPEKAKWDSYWQSLPIQNPVHEEARNNFFDLSKLAERTIYGGIEGMAGAIPAAEALLTPLRSSRNRPSALSARTEALQKYVPRPPRSPGKMAPPAPFLQIPPPSGANRSRPPAPARVGADNAFTSREPYTPHPGHPVQPPRPGTPPPGAMAGPLHPAAPAGVKPVSSQPAMPRHHSVRQSRGQDGTFNGGYSDD